MKYIAIVLLVFTIGCKEADTGPTTAEGQWTYTAPGGNVKVDFELVKSGTAWSIGTYSISIDGTKYNSAVQVTAVSPPTIGMIRINADDAKAVYAYPVTLNNGTVSADFTKITFTTASYFYPHSQNNNTTTAIATRP